MNKKTIIGLVLSVLLVILGGGYLIAAYVGTQSIKEQVQQYLKENNLQENVKIKGYSYNPLTGKVSLDGISIRGFPQPGTVIDIDRFEITEYSLPEGFRVPVRFEAYAYGIDAFIDGKNFRYDFYQKMWYDTEKNVFNIEKVQIKNQKLEVEFSAVLEKFRPELLKIDPQEKQTEYIEYLTEIFPSEVVVSYTDRGFTEEIIKEVAQRQKARPEKLKEILISELKTYREKSQDAYMKKLVEGAVYILENGGGRITINIKATQEITVDRLVLAFMFMGSLPVSDIISVLDDYYKAEITYGRAI
ncbi:hypothetical protein [Persephonella sp.]